MSTFTDIATESPLEAYLRLRGDGGRSCSSRSSTDASAATRSSAAARGSSPSMRPRAAREPVVGYLAYDHVARLEPTVALPADGPPFPESAFLVADELIRFDHGDDTPQLPCSSAAGPPPVRPFPRVRGAGAPRAGAHRRRGRLPGRALAAARAADDRLGGRPLPRAPARQSRRPTSSCSSSTGWR